MKDASKNIEDTVWTLIHNPVLNRLNSAGNNVHLNVHFNAQRNVRINVWNDVQRNVHFNVQRNVRDIRRNP